MEQKQTQTSDSLAPVETIEPVQQLSTGEAMCFESIYKTSQETSFVRVVTRMPQVRVSPQDY